MSNYTMDDLLDECLYGKKKKKKKVKKIIESEVNVKQILDEADKKTDKTNKEKEKEKEKKNKSSEEKTTNDIATLDAKDASAENSQKNVDKKKTKGDLVMTISLVISDSEQGKLEIGEKEYASITNINSLLSLYDINTKNIIDPKKATDTLSLTVEEQVSKSDKNNISMMMRSNVDGTLSINILINEMGQTFDTMDSAIVYFNQQYQNNILNIINKEVRA